MTILGRFTVAVLMALGVTAGSALAQQVDSSQRLLHRAIATLDSAETESGVDLLRTLLSSVPSREAYAVRVEAHMHLGAASLALGMEDSAIVHFREVVRLDPFFAVDPLRFNPDVRSLFRSIRSGTVAVRLRATPDTTLPPGAESYQISVAVGMPGEVTVRLRNTAAGPSALLTTLTVDSSASVDVPLLAADNSMIESGVYEVEAEMNTAAGRRNDLLTLTMERLSVDTMPHQPPIPESEFLPEEQTGTPSLIDVGRGLGFGLAATAVPTLLGNRDLRDNAVAPQAIVLGVAIALADILASRPMQPIVENVDYNSRLVAEWRAINLGAAADNDRLRRLARLRIRAGSER